ncbi:MAG: germination protein YpeB [Peptococcia bacterium]|jgi:spore germination protein
MKLKNKWLYLLIPAILLVGIIGTAVWGYQEMGTRQKLQNRAESQYQKAFYELTEHLNNITGQLAQILVTSSREQTTLTLATIWRQVFAAQANIGSLPLALVPLAQTEKFLDNTSVVSSYLLSQTAQSEGGLSENNIKTLEDLYQRAQDITNDLNKLGAKILNNELSWTQVEIAAYASDRDLEDNTIIDGFRLVEKKMEGYPELNLGEDFAPVEPQTKKISGEEEISAQDAGEKALRWWFKDPGKHRASFNYEGVGDIPTYGFEIAPLANETGPVYIDVSKLDGTIIWAMKARPVNVSKLELAEGEKKAQAFLENHDYRDFVAVKSHHEDNVGVYTFVPRQGEVLLYPDQVKLEVALDNGEIIGFEATPYYMFHRTREIPAAEISPERLHSFISERLKVEKVRPALIANTWGKEVLTWEVRGSFDEEKFAIFYDAKTGIEESIVRTTPTPKFTFTVEG